MNNWVFNDKNAGRTQSKSRGQEKEEEGKKKKNITGQKPWTRANWLSLVRPIHREATFR